MATKSKAKVSEQAPREKPQPASRPAATARLRTAELPIELPEGMWARIATKAYELWEQRGCPSGRDLENWLDAETIVMDEIHEARE